MLPTRPCRLKRAGLDYWEFVVVDVHKDWQAFDEFRRQQHGSGRLVAFSKFGRRHHATPNTYHKGDWLLFGAETTGLPDQVRRRRGVYGSSGYSAQRAPVSVIASTVQAHQATVASGGHIVRIPMVETHVRSLNLAVSVGVGVFEALRQRDGAHELPAS